MAAYWRVVWILFAVFAVANISFLHRVPGLMGDEASEGENVFELLQAGGIVVQGERSYIGPFIDYMRVPFVGLFGYTSLALRLVVVLASFATFWLAADVLRRMFGDTPAMFGLSLAFFSPIYLSFQRLGWAITLFPLFLFLILFFLTSNLKHRALLAGLAAGVGLANHILFLPTLITLGFGWLIAIKGRILSWWPAVVGFIAGFGTQFAVLVLNREDQGDPGAVASLFTERLADVPQLLPLVLSGSSYVARYTGAEFAAWATWLITGLLVVLCLAALRKKMAWIWLLGLIVQLLAMVYFADRFTLRYLFVFVFGVWILAGAGFGQMIELIPRRHLRGVGWGVAGVAMALTAGTAFAILIPFLQTGGSTADFSLANRTDSAAALVDTRGLTECVRGLGPVTSENVHIRNRLQFLSHEYADLEVVSEEEQSRAGYVVQYRDEEHPEAGDVCHSLKHFSVVTR